MSPSWETLEQELARHIRLLQQMELVQLGIADLVQADRLDELDDLRDETARLNAEIQTAFTRLQHQYPSGSVSRDDPNAERVLRLDAMMKDLSEKVRRMCAENEQRIREAMAAMASRLDQVQTGRTVLRKYQETADAADEVEGRRRQT